ncbi:MAG TPA: luciferase family protein [Candidatus Limnocylindrales bacterium]
MRVVSGDDEWLRELVLSVGGLVEAPSRYKDDLAYWVEGREIAHLEADDVLDLRLTRALIRELGDDPRVERRGSSDWATLTVSPESPEDEEFVREMVAAAVQANTAA